MKKSSKKAVDGKDRAQSAVRGASDQVKSRTSRDSHS